MRKENRPDIKAEELNARKEEVETLNKKLAELNEDELAEVTGGDWMRPSGGIPIIHGYREDNTKELDDLLNYRKKFKD